MIKEIDILGIYVSPMIGYITVTVIAWYLIRLLLEKAKAYRYIWHPPLFNTALFVIILSTLVILTL